MGLVKTRRLATMQKQQRAILLRQGYGGLKAGMKPAVGKGGAEKKSGGGDIVVTFRFKSEPRIWYNTTLRQSGKGCRE